MTLTEFQQRLVNAQEDLIQRAAELNAALVDADLTDEQKQIVDEACNEFHLLSEKIRILVNSILHEPG